MARILIGNIKGPQGAQGIQGPQGPVGATGPQGPMPPLTNNALATEPGVSALDACMGKTLQDEITQLNSDFEDVSNKINGKLYLLTSSHNLNNLTDTGFYEIGSSTPSNAPSGVGSWIPLLVFQITNTPHVVQIIYGNGTVWYRKKLSNWEPWYKFTSTVVS